MKTLPDTRRPGSCNGSGKAAVQARAAAVVVETMEPRTLMSSTTIEEWAASSQVFGINADNAGNLYYAGKALDAGFVSHAFVRRGLRQADGTFAWDTPIDFQMTPSKQAVFNEVDVDPAGNLYAVGYAEDAASKQWWVVVRKAPGGQPTLVDKYQFQAGSPAQANGLDIDDAGNVLVVGQALNVVSPTEHQTRWVVRRKSATGNSFTVQNNLDPVGQAEDAVITPNGVYVVGRTSPSHGVWLTQRGTTNASGAIAWEPFDVYNPAEEANGVGIAYDAATDSVYAVGYVQRPVEIPDWVVRRSVDGGAWTVDETVQNPFGSDRGAVANAVAADGAGNVYVTGWQRDAGGTYHTVVRHRNSDGLWSVLDDWSPDDGRVSTPMGIAVTRDGVFVSQTLHNPNAGDRAAVRQIGLPAPRPGDVNGDGRVDVTDLGVLSTNFGRQSGATRGQGDLDGDGDVDVADLGILATNFGRRAAQAQADVSLQPSRAATRRR